MSDFEHSFVLAAYRHSPWLEVCLQSLTAQTIKSSIFISTSTPFSQLDEIALRYGAELHIHGPNRGIGHDWNQALAVAKTPLVTVAHQDDIYLPEFVENIVFAHQKSPSAALSFCSAREILGSGELRSFAFNLAIKRLLTGLAFLGTDIAVADLRRRILFGFGNPVFCSGVTLNRRVLPEFSFSEDLKTNMDWLAWIELSRQGGIIQVPQVLLHRRIHSASETAACLSDGVRASEDRMVFDTLWPRPVAAMIAAVYKIGYAGYQ